MFTGIFLHFSFSYCRFHSGALAGRRDRNCPDHYMIDVGTMPDLIEAVNAVINNGKVAEIKIEKTTGTVTVVEQYRTLKRKINIEK